MSEPYQSSTRILGRYHISPTWPLLHMTRRSAFPIVTFLALSLAPLTSLAAPPKPAPAPQDPTQAAAIERYEKSRLLFEQKLYSASLAEALESIRIFPNYGSTLLAARNLRELGRFDESLDTYALLVRDYEERLKKVNKGQQYSAVLGEIDALRKLVGTIEIEGAEVGAMIVVDLRARGDFPLLEPIRVPAGTHLVRLYKEGYEPFETRIDVAGATTGHVHAPLVKLKVTGTLQVIETNGKELEVVVDGLSLGETGTVPWQGLLAPGEHTVLLRGEGDFGTMPVIVQVKPNALAPIRLTAEKLTSKVSIQTSPVNAELALDGVSLGRGLWSGKLRPGKHRVEIAADGFVLQVRDLDLRDGQQEKIETTLERDPLSPLWKDNRGRFFVEGSLGPMFVPTLGGDVASCAECSPLAGFGAFVQARGGYRFPSGFVVGVDAGFVGARQSVQERQTSVEPTGLGANQGSVNDRLTLSAAMLGVSGGIRLPTMPLTFRLGAGVLLGTLRDWRTGQFETTGQTPFGVAAGQSRGFSSLYLAPEVRLGIPLAKRFEFSAGLTGLFAIALKQPTWEPLASKVDARADGQAVFDADTLSGRAWFGLQMSMGVRYEF